MAKGQAPPSVFNPGNVAADRTGQRAFPPVRLT